MSSEDYWLDLERISKIKIPAHRILNVIENRMYNIEFNLEKEDDSYILIIAEAEELSIKNKSKISADEFERIMTNVLHSIQNGDIDKRLENDHVFSFYLEELIDGIVAELNDSSDMVFMTPEVLVHRETGIGVIQDLKTSEEIAIFESADFKTNLASDIEATLNHITSTVDVQKVLSEKDHLVSFYSLSDKKVFTFKFLCNESRVDQFNENKKDIGLSLSKVKLSSDSFTDRHGKYKLIVEQNKYKDLIKDIDINDEINEDIYSGFRKERLNIIKDFKERIRQEAIFLEFADIEI